MRESNEMGKLGKFVNYHKNAAETTRTGQTFDDIHRRNLPGFVRHMQGLQETRILGAVRLRLLINRTFFNQMSHLSMQTLPMEQLLDTPQINGHSRMTTSRASMEC
jgi:hypothetical protein